MTDLTQTQPPQRGCGAIELLLFAIACFLFGFFLIRTADAEVLFFRHFWLDEYLTSLIVLDPSVMHSIKAVKDGVDTNPPVYHLLLRGFFQVVGGQPEITFRLFSGLCMWGGLVFVYATLRRGFAIWPAVMGVLALTTNPMLIKQSSEARFYAPLLLAAACFTFFYSGDLNVRRPRLRIAMIALSAALCCTLHYFGLFIVIAVVAGDWFARPLSWRRLIPTAAGPLATLASIPIALSQRRGLTVPTWIEPVTFDSFSQLFGVVWEMRPIAILLFGAFLSLAWRVRRTGEIPAAKFSAEVLKPVAGMVGLFLVPLMVLAFSLVVQPSWVSKYAIAGSLAVAPLAALVASWTRKVALVIVAVCIVLLSFFQTKEFGRIEEARDKHSVTRARHWAARGDKQLLVFVVRKDAYLVPYALPKLRKRVLLVDMTSSGVAPPSTYHAYELQMAAKVQRHYPIAMIQPADVRGLPAFDFCGSSEEFAWLNKAIPLRKTAAGFFKAAAPAEASTAPATTASTAAMTTSAPAKKHKKH